MTDSHPSAKPLDPAVVGADPAANTDLHMILRAIQGLETSTQTKLDAIDKHITELETDLADGSDVHSTSGKNVPVTSAMTTVTTTTVSASTSNYSTLSKHLTANPIPLQTKPMTITSPVGKRPLVETDDNDTASRPKNKKKKLTKTKTKKSKLSTDKSDPSTDEGDQVSLVDQEMELLMKEDEASKPKYLEDPTTSDIQAPLAHLLQTWFWTVYSKDEVKTELSKTYHPANADALIPPKINEAFYHSLLPVALTKDMPSRFVQNAFMKAAQPFAIVWDALIQVEHHLKIQGQPLQVPCSDSFTVDFLFLHKQMDQGLRLLGIVNSQMVTHRKDVLAQYFNKDFKKLCKPHVPFDRWMFHSNLKGLLEDTIRVNRMVQQNKAQPVYKKSFSWGRGFPQGPHRGQGGFQQQRGKGFGRGWQQGNNTQQQQQQKKSGSQFKQQQTSK